MCRACEKHVIFAIANGGADSCVVGKHAAAVLMLARCAFFQTSPKRGQEAFCDQQGLTLAPKYRAPRQQGMGLVFQYLHGGYSKGLGARQGIANEGRSVNARVVVKHIGQGAGAQLTHSLPDAMRGRQRRQTARHYTVHAIDRHAHFPYPAGRAGRQIHAVRLAVGGALRILAQDS